MLAGAIVALPAIQAPPVQHDRGRRSAWLPGDRKWIGQAPHGVITFSDPSD